jgi:AmiR/NasT family two-component response regulator
MSTRTYRAVISEPNTTKRLNFRYALAATQQFDAIVPASSAEDVLHTLRAEVSVDVVFLSTRLGTENVHTLLQNARALTEGKDAAYVMLVERDQQHVGAIAANILQGADGQLCEPYSVEALQEVLELALRVRHERQQARARLALRLLVQEIAEQLDAVAELRGQRYKARLSAKLLCEMCEVLKDLSPELQAYFHEQLLEVFIARPQPKPKLYAGPSNRLRSKSEQAHCARIDVAKLRQKIQALG